MRIDVHAHHYDPEYLDALAKAGSTDGMIVAAAPANSRMTLAERNDLLDEAGIDVQVLSISALMPDVADEADAKSLARLSNDIFADAVAGHPGRYYAFGALPLPHVDAAIEETARCFDELDMVGVTLGCSMANRPLDDPEFAPLFAELDRRAAVLFLHPRFSALTPEYGLSWLIGGVIDDSVACLRLILSGMLDRYPNLRVIIPHLGGMVPFVAQRIDDGVERQRQTGFVAHTIERPPSEYLRRMWYDTVSEYAPALQCTCACVGHDRLLLGTDFPYTDYLKRCVSYIEDAELSDEAKTAILETNAASLLGLD